MHSFVVDTVALVGIVTQMRMGDVGFVQPFRYTFILWSTLLGILFFGHWPDHWTVAGATIVAGCGITSLWHEQRRSRRMLHEPVDADAALGGHAVARGEEEPA